MRRNFLVLLLVFPLFSRAGEIPPNVIPAGVGVNIHFVTGHQEDLDRIAAAGFKFIRMDFGWSAIERRKGEYDWKQYGELLEHLEQLLNKLFQEIFGYRSFRLCQSSSQVRNILH